MKLETFFEKFELFADAPNAVGKLRELVLQLAVRGQLVPQNPQDEPAAKAIEILMSHNGSKSAAKHFVEEESIELPFEVPASWKWVRFGDIVRIRTGKLDANAAVEGGAYPLFTCSKTPSQIATFSFDTSAVILAGNGDFNLKSYSGKFDAYQRTYVIEPLGWELGFCFWLISAQIKRITDHQRGSAIPYLRLGDIADPLVPFPPLAEQKRIVAKVDELMALCDRLEVQQQERDTLHAALDRAALARFAEAPTPANLDFLFHKSYTINPADLRKSILDLAVYGKLSAPAPDDGEIPSVEDFREAAALLAQSLGLRSPKKSPEEVETPFDVPAHWRWMALSDLGAAQTGTTPNKTDHDAFNGDIPFIKPADILPGGINYTNESLTRYGAESGGRLAPAGSLLMVCIGTIGKCNMIERECAFNQQINSLSPVQWVFSQYLLIALRSQYFQEAAWKKSSSTTIAILNKGKWLSIPVPLPPLAEQCRIVSKVNQLMDLVDKLESQIKNSRASAEKLMEAVVSELATGN